MTTAAEHIWKPSDSRIVVLDSFIPVPRGATFSAPAPLNWPAKDPDDVLDYQFDISPVVVGNDGDGIAPLAACRTRDFRSITTAVRLRRRGHQTAGGAPITS